MLTGSAAAMMSAEGPPFGGAGRPLIDRDREVSRLSDLVAKVGVRGGARADAVRDTVPRSFADVDLPEMRLGKLNDPAARALLRETAFAGRLADIDADARVLLLLGAEDEAPVETHPRAAEAILDRAVALAVSRSPVAAGLGRITGERFEFRRPPNVPTRLKCIRAFSFRLPAVDPVRAGWWPTSRVRRHVRQRQ